MKRILAAGAALTAPVATLAGSSSPPGTDRSAHQDRDPADDPQSAGIGSLDHVAIPMQNVDEMIAFYRSLGFGVREGTQIVSIHFGDQKINLHRPSLWQGGTFTLRASAARPPCGDFCWVWNGSRDALLEAFSRAGAEVEVEGERTGGRDGGEAVGQSTYTRDPDGNLLEFIRYE